MLAARARADIATIEDEVVFWRYFHQLFKEMGIGMDIGCCKNSHGMFLLFSRTSTNLRNSSGESSVWWKKKSSSLEVVMKR